jgi:glyoxylase-like metal-dependent hydrolase (beta-lactamase superfamily II)
MPLTVQSFVLDNRYAANCWVVRAEPGAPAAVIDPGGDPEPLVGAGVETAGILVTHGDVDHVAGVAELAERTGSDVWMPAGEADVLRTGATRGGAHVRAHDPEHEVKGGDIVSVAGIEFDVVDVPGHSAAHVAYHADGSLFSGDLLFERSVGRVDLAGGDWDQLLGSVQALLDRFGPDATVYPGHGGPTTLGRELESNPFLHELRSAAG